MKKNICFLCILIVIALLLPGCSAGKTVMKIGKLNVSYDMLRYFAKNYMNGYDGVSEESFRTDDELRKKLDDNVLSSLRELAAYVTLADKYGVKLDRDDKNTVDDKIADMKAEYSDTKAYKKGLEEAYATEAVIRRIYEIQLLCDKLYDHLTDGSDAAFRSDNETIEKDIADGNWFSAEYILITYSAKDKESRKEYAEKMLEGMDKDKSLRDLYDKNSTVADAAELAMYRSGNPVFLPEFRHALADRSPEGAVRRAIACRAVSTLDAADKRILEDLETLAATPCIPLPEKGIAAPDTDFVRLSALLALLEAARNGNREAAKIYDRSMQLLKQLPAGLTGPAFREYLRQVDAFARNQPVECSRLPVVPVSFSTQQGVSR